MTLLTRPVLVALMCSHSSEESSDGATGRRMFCCRLRGLSARRLQPPEASLLSARGRSMHCCYQRLLKAQLQWHISTGDVTERVEKEQVDVMQARPLNPPL